MNAVLKNLEANGCIISKGFESCNGAEDVYLHRLKMLAENDAAIKLNDAYVRSDMNKLRSYSCSLAQTFFNLGLMTLFYLNEKILDSACSGSINELDSLIPQFVDAFSKFSGIVLSTPFS